MLSISVNNFTQCSVFGAMITLSDRNMMF